MPTHRIVLHVNRQPLRLIAEFDSEDEAFGALPGFKKYENAGEEYCIQEITPPSSPSPSQNHSR